MNLAANLMDIEVTTRPKLTLKWRGKTTPVPDITFFDVTEPKAPPALPARHVLTVEPFDELSPLQICLNHWTSWMKCDDRDLGAKGQTGIRSGADEDHEGYDDGGYAAEAAADRDSREIATATNAMIFSMPQYLRAAIFRRCNVATVWRFPNMDFAVALPEAEAMLIEKLSKNIATRAFF